MKILPRSRSTITSTCGFQLPYEYSTMYWLSITRSSKVPASWSKTRYFSFWADYFKSRAFQYSVVIWCNRSVLKLRGYTCVRHTQYIRMNEHFKLDKMESKNTFIRKIGKEYNSSQFLICYKIITLFSKAHSVQTNGPFSANLAFVFRSLIHS